MKVELLMCVPAMSGWGGGGGGWGGGGVCPRLSKGKGGGDPKKDVRSPGLERAQAGSGQTRRRDGKELKGSYIFLSVGSERWADLTA